MNGLDEWTVCILYTYTDCRHRRDLRCRSRVLHCWRVTLLWSGFYTGRHSALERAAWRPSAATDNDDHQSPGGASRTRGNDEYLHSWTGHVMATEISSSSSAAAAPGVKALTNSHLLRLNDCVWNRTQYWIHNTTLHSHQPPAYYLLTVV